MGGQNGIFCDNIFYTVIRHQSINIMVNFYFEKIVVIKFGNCLIPVYIKVKMNLSDSECDDPKLSTSKKKSNT